MASRAVSSWSREEKPALGWQETVETGENYLFGSTLDPFGAGIHFEQQDPRALSSMWSPACATVADLTLILVPLGGGVMTDKLFHSVSSF